MINWLRPRYLSIGTNEASNSTWGIGWAVENGATTLKTWPTISAYCNYIHSHAEPPSSQAHQRPRRILWHLNYRLEEYGPRENDDIFNGCYTNIDDNDYFIDITDVMLLPEFHQYLQEWMAWEEENAIFRASWFDATPTNNYRKDIRSLLWALIPMGDLA